jgi:hypothetical protein
MDARAVIDLLHHTEPILDHTIRAWTGPATDEGIGIITLIEVSDSRGLPVCRFEVFLADSVRRLDTRWPLGTQAALEALQTHAIERARHAVLAATLPDLNGHRYDLDA